MKNVKLIEITVNFKTDQHIWKFQFFIFQRRSQALVPPGISVTGYIGENPLKKQGRGRPFLLIQFRLYVRPGSAIECFLSMQVNVK